MPFMEASVWSLFGLLPLLVLLLLCPRRRVMLSKCQLCKDADKAHEIEAKKADDGNYMQSHQNGSFERAGLFRPDLHGMDIYEIKVLEFLEHGTSSLLGIFGMHGVGKSTLMRLLHTTYLQYRPFEYFFYLELNHGCTVEIFLDVLASTIGLDDMWHQMSNALLAETISSRLKGKTFLLLLDDLPDAIDLSAIGLPVPLGHRQKVVFTARDQATCANMGCAAGDTVLEMQRLGEDDAWNLFRYHVGEETFNSDPWIEHIAKKMVAECRGFPKALCTVGRSIDRPDGLLPMDGRL